MTRIQEEPNTKRSRAWKFSAIVSRSETNPHHGQVRGPLSAFVSPLPLVWTASWRALGKLALTNTYSAWSITGEQFRTAFLHIVAGSAFDVCLTSSTDPSQPFAAHSAGDALTRMLVAQDFVHIGGKLESYCRLLMSGTAMRRIDPYQVVIPRQ